MLIGNPAEFAIECINLEIVGECHYGSIFIWINNHQVGTGDTILITTMTHFLVNVLLDSKQRQDPTLENGDAKEILNTVWHQCYGNEEGYDAQKSTFYWPYVWIHGSPGFEPVRSIVIDVPTGYRVVWQTDELAEIQDYIIDTRTCRDIIQAFLGWFEKETGCIHRCYTLVTKDHSALKVGRRAEAERNRKTKYEQRQKDRNRELGKLTQ